MQKRLNHGRATVPGKKGKAAILRSRPERVQPRNIELGVDRHVIAHEYPGPLTKLLAHGAVTGISDAVDALKATLSGSFAFLVIVRHGLD
jgi:hypothetical protein